MDKQYHRLQSMGWNSAYIPNQRLQRFGNEEEISYHNFTGQVITYPRWNQIWSMLVEIPQVIDADCHEYMLFKVTFNSIVYLRWRHE